MQMNLLTRPESQFNIFLSNEKTNNSGTRRATVLFSLPLVINATIFDLFLFFFIRLLAPLDLLGFALIISIVYKHMAV
jgi:hypothetical protein